MFVRPCVSNGFVIALKHVKNHNQFSASAITLKNKTIVDKAVEGAQNLAENTKETLKTVKETVTNAAKTVAAGPNPGSAFPKSKLQTAEKLQEMENMTAIKDQRNAENYAKEFAKQHPKNIHGHLGNADTGSFTPKGR